LSFRDPWVKDGRILWWCSFQRAGSRAESGTLLPQGLYVKLDVTGGPRYQLDRHEQYVSWMGLTFYWSFAQSKGITLFNIRFRGERILYELGLQEAMSLYAGGDPVQGAVAYLELFRNGSCHVCIGTRYEAMI
jgi:hypothetical protein